MMTATIRPKTSDRTSELFTVPVGIVLRGGGVYSVGGNYFPASRVVKIER